MGNFIGFLYRQDCVKHLIFFSISFTKGVEELILTSIGLAADLWDIEFISLMTWRDCSLPVLGISLDHSTLRKAFNIWLSPWDVLDGSQHKLR